MLKTKSLKPTLFTQRFPSGKNGSRNGAAISKRSTNKVTSILNPKPASTAISFKKFDDNLEPAPYKVVSFVQMFPASTNNAPFKRDTRGKRSSVFASNL